MRCRRDGCAPDGAPLPLYTACRPESLGLASGVVFLMCAIFFQLLHFTNGSARADEVCHPAQRAA